MGKADTQEGEMLRAINRIIPDDKISWKFITKTNY